MSRFRVALSFLMSAALPLFAQTGSVRGVIVAKGTNVRLPYGIVSIVGLEREQFSTDSGTFFIGGVPRGTWTLRVRRLGFLPVDLPVVVTDSATTDVTVELQRTAVRLLGVNVRSYPPCREPGAPSAEVDSSLATIFTQLRLNAQQYRLLADAYPFTYIMEAVHTQRMKKTGEVMLDRKDYVRETSNSDWRYKPGGMVSRRRSNWFFHVPELKDLADSLFVSSHCFHYAGTETVHDSLMIRVDFVAAERIKDSDVNGSVYFHPETFQVQRTLLQLSKPIPQLKEITDFEITTDFAEIMPSVPIIANIWSVQTLDPKSWRPYDVAYEHQHIISFGFVGRKPGDEIKADAKAKPQ